jgi:hypothetical protein
MLPVGTDFLSDNNHVFRVPERHRIETRVQMVKLLHKRA